MRFSPHRPRVDALHRASRERYAVRRGDGRYLASTEPVAWARSPGALFESRRQAEALIAEKWIGVEAAKDLLGIRAIKV